MSYTEGSNRVGPTKNRQGNQSQQVTYTLINKAKSSHLEI
ncbi:Protein of unknown function [Pyronema omphalodes CBS 100304]|uniref:Uncharacterized protein n=1 Tax=Pyronema omphalodes (strain CBS 100304) TaxID=1076935 RepID=U4L1F7_PYROM|nr:Protein of unknown function [Pyronema omphalodes CBS 100304]